MEEFDGSFLTNDFKEINLEKKRKCCSKCLNYCNSLFNNIYINTK